MAEVTFLHRLASYVAAGYLHLVGKTSLVQTLDHPSYLSIRRERKPVIYSFWHNTQAFLAYYHRGEHAKVIVSQSRDGEYVAQVMEKLGLDAIRGSTSTGARAAYREMIEELEKGHQVGITPDGPRGPVYSVSPGVIGAAQASGAPIVPTTMRATRKIVFSSWDRFVLPLPFSRIIVGHGRPIRISKDETAEMGKERLLAAMKKIETECELGLKTTPSWGVKLSGLFLFCCYVAAGVILLPLLLPLAFLKYGIRRTLKRLRERILGGEVQSETKRRLWFHSASIGEWQALRPLLKKFQTISDVALFVTTSTFEAKKLISQQEPDLAVSLLPLDLPFIMARFIRKLKPSALVLIETELWPLMIQKCRSSLIPVVVANGRLSKKSLMGWEFVKPLASRFLSQVSWFFVRSKEDARHFTQLGASPLRITVSGNTKSDNLKILSWEDKQKKRKEFFRNPEGVYVVAGSTWPTEEATILRVVSKLTETKIRLILAPRRPERFAEVEKILEKTACSWSKWSMVKNLGEWTTDALLVDTLGDLKDLYAVGDVAFIGGTLLRKGGQNPLEPASARLPLLFGPHMENFNEEAAEFKKRGAARQVRHEKDLLLDLSDLMRDESLRYSMGEAAANVVMSKQGAVERTFQGLRESLDL